MKRVAYTDVPRMIGSSVEAHSMARNDVPISTRYLPALAVIALAALTIVAFVQTRCPDVTSERLVRSRAPEGVMGTECRLVVVADPGDAAAAEQALTGAEAALRLVEARMSTWLDGSELSRFNRAPAGEAFALSPMTLAVLRLAQDVSRQSGGAFDVTCGPLIGLWKSCAREGRIPTDPEIRDTLGTVGYMGLTVREETATKQTAGMRVDLAAIAKGYGVDQALAAMQAIEGIRGGLVDVGGDIACFGTPPAGEAWPIGIRDPFHPDASLRIEQADVADTDPEVWQVLGISEGGVCTSGNYFRFSEIDGRRYSHIVDPRTGHPADATPSVTVVAPTAALADAWATALSVLGPGGLDLVPPNADIHALLVIGDPDNFETVATPGFHERWGTGGE